MQLCFQAELTEEKLQLLHSQKYCTAVSTTNLRHERKQTLLLNVIKKFCVQARNRPEIFW